MISKRSALWSFCSLAAIVALVWPALPLSSGSDRLGRLPVSGPGFQSKPIELTAVDHEFLGGARGVQRLVQLHGGGRLMVTVIDGSGNRHAVHDPTYCLAGGGWKIRRQQTVLLQSGEAIWMAMEKDGRTMESMWFFDDGKRQFTSPFAYWLRTGARRVTLGRSGPEPVLVSLRTLPGESVDWHRVRQILLPGLGFR